MAEEDFELSGELNSPDSIADVLGSAFSETSEDISVSATTETPKPQETSASTPSPTSGEASSTSEEEPKPAVSSAPSAEPASSETSSTAEASTPAKSVPSDADLARASMETIAKLQAQTAELQRQLLEAQKIQKTQAQEPSPEASALKEIFRASKPEDFGFSITDNLYNALYGEESTPAQRKAALTAFASGIAMTTRDQLMKTFGTWVKDNFDAVPRVVDYLTRSQAAQQSSAEQLRSDFFTKFPDLKKPELAPLIRATIKQVQDETKATAWSAQLRDLVGARVQGILRAYAQVAQPKVPVPPVPTPQVASVRPAVPVQDPNSAEEIFATLNTSF